jgi:predicted metal-dependent hydrolase
MAEIPIKKIVRSRRKTIGFEITPDASLIIRAPLRASKVYISDLVRQKDTWIQRKIGELKQRQVSPCHEYAEGEQFLFLGRSYPLHITEDGSITIERSDKLYVHRTLMPHIRHQLKYWYREEARKELQARCMWFSIKTGYTPSSIHITDARKRWGSCSGTGSINFSWRLIQAPNEIVDYVVVHELIHIGQPDHSKKFWGKVRKIMPDFERRRKWLHENEHLLGI